MVNAGLPISKVVFHMAKKKAMEHGADEDDITYTSGKTKISISDKTGDEDLHKQYTDIFRECLESASKAVRDVIVDMAGITEKDLRYINVVIGPAGEVEVIQAKRLPKGYDQRLREIQRNVAITVRKLSDLVVLNNNVTQN